MAGPLFGAIERAQLCDLFGELAGPGLVLPGARAAWRNDDEVLTLSNFTWLARRSGQGRRQGVIRIGQPEWVLRLVPGTAPPGGGRSGPGRLS